MSPDPDADPDSGVKRCGTEGRKTVGYGTQKNVGQKDAAEQKDAAGQKDADRRMQQSRRMLTRAIGPGSVHTVC